MTTWTDELKESVSKQCEREREFGFSSLAIRQALNKMHKSHKGFRFEKISIELYQQHR